jgi:excisionase family DNA binding protein
MPMTGGEFEESFLTVAEVAELLRLNQQTVRNWIDAGTLPAIRVGRRVRIKRSDLNRILESGYRGTPPAASSIEGPSATDFWSGEPVGAVEPGSSEGEAAEVSSSPGDSAQPSGARQGTTGEAP